MPKSNSELRQRIIEILEDAADGLTSEEIQPILDSKYGIRAHHGRISGPLSNAHKSLDVFYLKMKRGRFHPYVHSKYRSNYPDTQRVDYPRTKNKWRDVADLLYFVMTADSIPPNAWENALETYRKMSND